MSPNKPVTKKVEFGDFQTPVELANLVCKAILARVPNPKVVIEPTCGAGAFLESAAKHFASAKHLIGWEINPEYVRVARSNLEHLPNIKIEVLQHDFFDTDWESLICNHPEPFLFLGNPPWVTNSRIAGLESANLPTKSNFQGFKGIEAMTGKANFDISEWMLIQILLFISGKHAASAFLVKTAVARKLFLFACKNRLKIGNFSISLVDARRYFGAAVDACLFYAEGTSAPSLECCVYDRIGNSKPSHVVGIRGGSLVANVSTYDDLQEIDGESEIKWRSGVKHDCSRVMELRKIGNKLFNRDKEHINITDSHFLYPMYKSSDLSKEELSPPCRWMIVPQKKIGEETEIIRQISPSTWEYLRDNSELLSKRKSVIYKKAPKFAIFGVGNYTFQPWKIAIAGLSKRVRFHLIGPCLDKPVVLDDTCYLLGFPDKETANYAYSLLSSETALNFLESLIFTDNKRPITAGLLNRVNLKALADHCGSRGNYSLIERLQEQLIL